MCINHSYSDCHKRLFCAARGVIERSAPRWAGEQLQKGFTLVEMLIASLLFTVAMVSLLSMVLFALASRFASRLESTALKLSQQKVEQLKSCRPDDPALSISGNPLNSFGEIDFDAASDPEATAITELTLNKTRNSKLLFETRWNITTAGTKKVISVATRKISGSPIVLEPVSLKVVVAP
jgi:prepilin-type N-terminal cleavage/methylation domain-containing protein